MKYYLRVCRYLRPYSGLATVSVVLIALGSLATLLVPWPLKIIFDNVLGDAPLPPVIDRLLGPIADSRIHLLLFAVLAGLAVAAVQNGLPVIDNYVNGKIEQNMILDFRSDVFQHAQRLSLSFHNERRAGGLIYAINYQGDAAARLVMVIPPLAQSLITLVGMFWISLHLDRQLALLSLIVVPVLYYAVGYYMRNVHARLAEVRDMEGESLSIVHEAMSMLRVIVAFGREDHEHSRFRRQGKRAVDARIKLTVRQTLFSLVVNTTTAVGTALVLGFGAYHVLQHQITAGELLILLAYTAAMYTPLETISTTVAGLQEQFINLQLAFDLLDTEPEVVDQPHAVDIGRANGHVTYEGVHFSYKGRVGTLQSISLEARPGQVVGIVGPTGAGKSTLVGLLPRFYDPGVGRVLLDGVDIRNLTVKSLRRQMSIVLQEPLLFSGTIADNIRYGRLDATMDEIIQAAKDANAHDFIVRLPDAYETKLGERGAQLSGGERQRISVARAFLKDAPILILDEPTSSIDSKTEAVILDALDRLMIGRTTFMIAHRLSTIRNADTILVIHDGRLVQQGTHEALIRQDGLYQQLCDMQTGHTRRFSLLRGPDATSAREGAATRVDEGLFAKRERSSPDVDAKATNGLSGGAQLAAPMDGTGDTDWVITSLVLPSDITIFAPPDVLRAGSATPLRLSINAARDVLDLAHETEDGGHVLQFYYHWSDEQGVMLMNGDCLASIPAAVWSLETLECSVIVQVPEQEGLSLLELGLVGVNPTWLDGRSSRPGHLRVWVSTRDAELARLESVALDT